MVVVVEAVASAGVADSAAARGPVVAFLEEPDRAAVSPEVEHVPQSAVRRPSVDLRLLRVHPCPARVRASVPAHVPMLAAETSLAGIAPQFNRAGIAPVSDKGASLVRQRCRALDRAVAPESGQGAASEIDPALASVQGRGLVTVRALGRELRIALALDRVSRIDRVLDNCPEIVCQDWVATAELVPVCQTRELGCKTAWRTARLLQTGEPT